MTEELFKFHQAQEEIAADLHRFRVVNCGRRFGKTILSTWEIVSKALYSKDGNVAYIAPTYQQARDICWAELKKIVRPIVKSINESRLEIIVINRIPNSDGTFGTSKIVLRGWESVETLRGQKFNFLVVDEVAMMSNFWVGWQEVLLPTLTDNSGHAMFLSTPKGFNHFYDLFNMENRSADFKSFHFTTYDNPHIKHKEIEVIRSNMPQDSFAQEYLAEFRKMQGLVYPEFNREKHVLSLEEAESLKDKEWVETIAGVDWGYQNPASVLQIKKDQDGVYYVTSEWYKRHKTTEQIIEIVKDYKPHCVYPDPAETDRVRALTDNGFNVREVSKDIAAGVDRVREMFLQNRIKIHPDCQNLILELETYHYPDKKLNINEQEKPKKENDHAVDALRYVIYNNAPLEHMFTQHDFALYAQSYD